MPSLPSLSTPNARYYRGEGGVEEDHESACQLIVKAFNEQIRKSSNNDLVRAITKTSLQWAGIHQTMMEHAGWSPELAEAAEGVLKSFTGEGVGEDEGVGGGGRGG